jgi:hypothetical protein
LPLSSLRDDFIHLRHSRPIFKPTGKRIERCLITTSQHLDITIRKIMRVPGYLQWLGDAPCAFSKPNTLDTAFDRE